MDFTLLRLCALAWAAVACVPALVLLGVAHTGTGRVFAVAALLIGLAPLAGCLARERASRAWARAAMVLPLGWLVLTVWLVFQAPSGRALPGARVHTVYTRGSWQFPRFALGNLLPEVDQLRLGFRVAQAGDPLFTGEQRRRVEPLTTSLYDELEADPDFHALGSAMPHVYEAIWGLGDGDEQAYVYLPPTVDRTKPSPVLVFLHGSGGNFKAYTWLLSQVADELGLVVVSPGFGLGDWRKESTPGVIQRALNEAGRLAVLDPGRRHLAGLSNGGLGVCQAGLALGTEFQTLIFLSPVMDDETLGSPGFARQWRGRPVRVITGVEDERVPVAYVRERAQKLRAIGAEVSLREIPAADHFMLFSHRRDVLAELTKWLGEGKLKSDL